MALSDQNDSRSGKVAFRFHGDLLGDFQLVVRLVTSHSRQSQSFLDVSDDDISEGQDRSDLSAVLADPVGGGEIEAEDLFQ
jgi:hypothetical protein